MPTKKFKTFLYIKLRFHKMDERRFAKRVAVSTCILWKGFTKRQKGKNNCLIYSWLCMKTILRSLGLLLISAALSI